MHDKIIASCMMHYDVTNITHCVIYCQIAYFSFYQLKRKICIFRCHMSKYFRPKPRFFGSIFFVTIMLSFLHDYYIKYFCYFFDSNLHKSQKISGKWTRSMSKNRYVKTFLGNSTRCQVFCGTFLERNKLHDIWCVNCKYDIVFIFIKQITCQIDDNHLCLHIFMQGFKTHINLNIIHHF